MQRCAVKVLQGCSVALMPRVREAGQVVGRDRQEGRDEVSFVNHKSMYNGICQPE